MSDVIQNQLLAGRLGWTPDEIVPGATAIDDDFVAQVVTRQHALGVPADGICGPRTYAAVLVQRMATLAGGTGEQKLINAGQIAVCEAKRIWLRNIIDLPPPGTPAYEPARQTIDQMIRTQLGLGWTWEEPYDGNYEWCGAFCSYAWRAGGIPLTMRKHFFSSTHRLDRWARYKPFENTANPKPSNPPYRQLLELNEDSPYGAGAPIGRFMPRAGDILLVGGVNTAYGKHICLVESYDESSGWFTTLEGNGTGLGPTGQRQHGVVRGRRSVGLRTRSAPTTYFARRLIRPSVVDLT